MSTPLFSLADLPSSGLQDVTGNRSHLGSTSQSPISTLGSLTSRIGSRRGSSRIRCPDSSADLHNDDDLADWKPVLAKMNLKNAILHCQDRMSEATSASSPRHLPSVIAQPHDFEVRPAWHDLHCAYWRGVLRSKYGLHTASTKCLRGVVNVRASPFRCAVGNVATPGHARFC